MIVVTGAYGFIGSCVVQELNNRGRSDIVVVDNFYASYKERNLESKGIQEWVHRDIFLHWFSQSYHLVSFVLHLGARTDTTSQDVEIFDSLNLNYSQEVWSICTRHNIPLIYASSAATYGLGECGFSDTMDDLSLLKPLNAYADSKQKFDLWALTQAHAPPKWYGLKFFNVYGPNEYHKGRMASVVFHAFRQIRKTGRMRLFRSHRSDVLDGEQKRDFIYVKDVVNVCLDLMERQPDSGLYNVGTGNARTFADLVGAVFAALKREKDIEFIDTPEDIRDTYQYFTEAEMQKLRMTGYGAPFSTLEDGVNDYVQSYLLPHVVY